MNFGEILDTSGQVKHKTYEIQKNDTPQAVADSLEILLDELRHYHNFNCIEDADVINAHFPGHLKYILLKPVKLKANGEIEDEPLENVRFSTKTYQLPFRPSGTNRYLGVYTIENGQKKHSIKEEINVKWLATDVNRYSFFEITRISKIYIDENESNSIADKIAEKMASVFYPIQIVVNQKGKWIDIHNYDAMTERWEKGKPKILKEYKGKQMEECVNRFEEKIENKNAILESFNSNWFLRSLFNGINIEYKDNLIRTKNTYFPICDATGDVQFCIEQEIKPSLDKYNLISVTQKGVLSDSRSKQDFQNDTDFPYDTLLEENPEKAKGIYNAYYFLNPNTYTVESLFLECSIDLDVPKKITVTISNLDEKDNLKPKSKLSFYDGEVKSSDSFFNKLSDMFKIKQDL